MADPDPKMAALLTSRWPTRTCQNGRPWPQDGRPGHDVRGRDPHDVSRHAQAERGDVTGDVTAGGHLAPRRCETRRPSCLLAAILTPASAGSHLDARWCKAWRPS